MTLEDGTNAEGEDLATPLPSLWTRESLTSVMLYGTHASPATCKTRALLNLAGITYQTRFGKVAGSSYTKFPVVVLNGKYQVNDSHIIYKTLAPLLFPELGKPTKEDVELEHMVTFGLMLACEIEAFNSVDCMKRWTATAGMTGVTGFLLRNFAPLSLAKYGADRIVRRNPGLKTPLEYCQDLQKDLDRRGSEYFNGNTAGPLDASIYGAIAIWAPGGEKTMPFMAEALQASGLCEWYIRADRAVPSIWNLCGIWPFYT